MQYAVNLKSLDLSENSITDLSPLAGLENLTYLELDRNNITDLAPLSGLTGLEHLNLYNNLIYATLRPSPRWIR
nr:leucine-rich repeat domain-containing protein [Pseudoflavonifractor sp. MCC625]